MPKPGSPVLYLQCIEQKTNSRGAGGSFSLKPAGFSDSGHEINVLFRATLAS